MASPLPELPDNPLGDVPDNPLGPAPRVATIGGRGPIRFPSGGRGALARRRASGGAASGRAPLPSLGALTRRMQPRTSAPAPAPTSRPRPAQVSGGGPTIVVTPRPRHAVAPVERQPVPGRLAQPPLNPQSGMRGTLRQRLQGRQRGEAVAAFRASMGAHAAYEQTEQTEQTEQARGPGLTPEQRAILREAAAQNRAILNGTAPNPMEPGLGRMLGTDAPQRPIAGGH